MTITRQVLLAVHDNERASTKHIAKHLNLAPNQVYPALYQLRKSGLIEHVGYARWGVTDNGRLAAGDIINGKQTPLRQKEAPEASGEIDWQREYIKLATEIARSRQVHIVVDRDGKEVPVTGEVGQ